MKSKNYIHDYVNDFLDDFRFYNGQNSFNNSPEFDGDKNIENEILYKHDLNEIHQRSW